MALTPLAQTALVLAIVVVGILLERRVMGTETLFSVPRWLQTAVAGFALAGPWFLYFQGLIPSALVDGFVVAIAASLALWLVAMKTVGVGGARGAGC